MRQRTLSAVAWRALALLLVPAIFGTFGVLSPVEAQSQPKPPQSVQKGSDTAEEAVQALIAASESYDVPALLELLGSDGKDLVESGEPVRDKTRATAFAARARRKNVLVKDSKNSVVLNVGDEAWPFPIPIVKRNAKWYFDTKAGRMEILYRRIGENELDAIQICRGFDDAQAEYASQKHDNSLVNQYAQRILSTPGKHDGLAWQNADGSWGGPIGENAARAMAEGYSAGQPYHGYYFKVLKGQGSAVRMGEMDFVVEGVMIGGFALVAAPAQYRVTGVKTFVVNQDGIVYEKDLGPDTPTVFKNMERYNPDKTWRQTDDGS